MSDQSGLPDFTDLDAVKAGLVKLSEPTPSPPPIPLPVIRVTQSTTPVPPTRITVKLPPPPEELPRLVEEKKVEETEDIPPASVPVVLETVQDTTSHATSLVDDVEKVAKEKPLPLPLKVRNDSHCFSHKVSPTQIENLRRCHDSGVQKIHSKAHFDTVQK